RQNPSKTPKPNRAKSYFTGSVGSNFLKLASNSCKALASFCFLVSKFNLRATFPECTSNGQDNSAGEIDFQMPKSTPLLSLRHIHLKYIFSLLEEEPFNGSEICLVVRLGWSISKKIFLKSEIRCCKLRWLLLKNTCSNPPWWV